MTDAEVQKVKLDPPYDNITVVYPVSNPVTGEGSVRIENALTGQNLYWSGEYAQALAGTVLGTMGASRDDRS